MNAQEILDAHHKALDEKIARKDKALELARQRIEQLCSIVNTLAKFRKVMVANFLEDIE